MWNDLRFVLRTLRRSPGFSVMAILSLALGIGANTAIFSLLYQVVLRSLPVRNATALVSLESDSYTFGWARRDNNHGIFSYPIYRELRDRNQVFSGLIGRASFPSTLARNGDAVRTVAEVVTGNFFEVLGVKPAIGRLLAPADDSPNSPSPVIVLSYFYWANHLGQDPTVLNSRILMNGHPVLVVGVAARGFRGLLAGQTPDFFAPVSMMPLVSPGWLRSDQPDAWWLNAVGRLKPGVSYAQADATLPPLFHSILESEIPRMEDVTTEGRKKLLAKTLAVSPAAQGLNILRERWQTPLLVLMVMVGLVLLIACANVANLLIARATARQWEIAVRAALGATRWQIARQVLTESLTLSVAGGLLGVFLSDTFTQGLLRLLPVDESGGWLAAQIDLRMLAFGMLLALLTGVCFGLLPALQAARPDVASALKQHDKAMTAGSSQSRARQTLAVAQICISLLLLVGAGLFSRSLINLVYTDPGFRAEHLVTFSVDPSLNGYSRERAAVLFRDLEARLRTLPLATSVVRSAFAPFAGWNWGNGAKAPGSPRASEAYVYFGQDAVDPGYFRALGIPLLAGREFAESDNANAPQVVIVNETLARYLFDNQNPVGRRLLLGAKDTDVQIVGVVKDSKYSDVREEPGRFLYVPFEQAGPGFVSEATFLVRTRGEERQAMGQVRAIVKQLDANLPLRRLTSMKTMIDDTIYTDRLIATLAVAFGVLATILAAVGLYGTVSYSVARRTPEFALRLVMGAEPRSLLLHLLRDTGRMVGIGIAVGLPASYGLARLAEAQFFGIRAYDPWVLTLATLFIAAVALLAALVPALRAMRIEPIRALRYE